MYTKKIKVNTDKRSQDSRKCNLNEIIKSETHGHSQCGPYLASEGAGKMKEKLLPLFLYWSLSVHQYF